MFQEGMNNMFYKGLIHYYEKSYMFITEINKIKYGQKSNKDILKNKFQQIKEKTYIIINKIKV